MPNRAFTLIELVIAMVVIGLVVVIAGPQMNNLPKSKAQFAVRKMQSDVRYAQLLAMETSARTRVSFNTSTDIYQLERESSPGTWVSVTNPATKSAYNVTLNTGDYAGVDITAASLDGNSTVIFNSYGAPFNAAETSLSDASYAELNAKYQLRFRAETGKADIVTL